MLLGISVLTVKGEGSDETLEMNYLFASMIEGGLPLFFRGDNLYTCCFC